MRANILKLFTNKFAQKQKNPFAEPLYPKKMTPGRSGNHRERPGVHGGKQKKSPRDLSSCR